MSTQEESSDADPERSTAVWGSGGRVPAATVRGGVVTKPAGPWVTSVVSLLLHLREVGFTGAPEVVDGGVDGAGRMMVRWVPGSSVHPQAWSDEGAARVGALLRELHDATAGFHPRTPCRWQQTWLRGVRSDDVVLSHCDTGPWNLVGRLGVPHALIDWEFAGPVDRDVEVAQTAWLNAQLHDDDVAAMHELPDATTRARQFELILDGYGVPAHRRETIVDLMIELAVQGAREEARRHAVTPTSTEAVAVDGYPILWAIT